MPQTPNRDGRDPDSAQGPTGPRRGGRPLAPLGAMLVALAAAFPLAAAGLGERPKAQVTATTPAASTARYIVVLKDDLAPSNRDRTPEARTLATALTTAHGGKVELVYGAALFGFSAELTEAQAKSMAADARVKYVEPDQPMKAMPK